MCGIVAYTGKRNAAPILLEGLARLEYRGYDSAGICVVADDETLQCVKRSGKVSNLAAACGQLSGNCGIAHTRWATHGAPSEANAHPHLDSTNRFAVVHNGIIENFQELRSRLEASGCRFRSATDSEVLPLLTARNFHGNLMEAVSAALREVTGTYGIAVISQDAPGEIVCARNGSPVVIGLGDSGNMVASDVSALDANIRKVIYLNDGEIARITPERVEVRNAGNLPVAPRETSIDPAATRSGKGNFEHFMLKEIHEQPEAVTNTLRGRLDAHSGNSLLGGLNLSAAEMASINRIVIAGCGSSMHAGMVGRYYFEDIAGIPTQVEQAAEFRYRNPIIEPHTLVIPISQSGETADTLAAVREAETKGALIAAISNVVGSTIARECGRGVYLHAGPEISVASTKAFLCQSVTLLLMALHFARNRRMNQTEGAAMVQEIAAIPALIQSVLDKAPGIRDLARSYAHFENMFFIGRGPLYPAALEGALKLKEVSYIHAEGYQAAELKHGPIALLSEITPVVALLNDIPGKEKMRGNVQECLARHAPVIAVVSEGEAEVPGTARIEVPRCSRFIAPIVTVAALQLFAYYCAAFRDCPIDQPRNLAKSVTVE